jgi:large-conductance mechanosensitive channel
MHIVLLFIFFVFIAVAIFCAVMAINSCSRIPSTEQVVAFMFPPHLSRENVLRRRLEAMPYHILL